MDFCAPPVHVLPLFICRVIFSPFEIIKKENKTTNKISKKKYTEIKYGDRSPELEFKREGDITSQTKCLRQKKGPLTYCLPSKYVKSVDHVPAKCVKGCLNSFLISRVRGMHCYIYLILSRVGSKFYVVDLNENFIAE